MLGVFEQQQRGLLVLRSVSKRVMVEWPGADIVSSESTLSVKLSLGVLISCTRDVVLGLDPKLHCILWEGRDIGD